jgi:hypothetical protein
MWYQRPSELFFYMLQASKTNGKTNRLPEIENLQKNFDVNLIVNFEDAIMSKKKE